MTSGNHFRTLAYTFLFTSMAINLTSVRAHLASDRERHAARYQMIESLVQRLRNGEDVPVDEIEQTRRLAWGGTAGGAPKDGKISWRDVFFGRR